MLVTDSNLRLHPTCNSCTIASCCKITSETASSSSSWTLLHQTHSNVWSIPIWAHACTGERGNEEETGSEDDFDSEEFHEQLVYIWLKQVYILYIISSGQWWKHLHPYCNNFNPQNLLFYLALWIIIFVGHAFKCFMESRCTKDLFG